MVGHDTTTGDAGVWKVEGAFRRGATATVTAIGSPTVTALGVDAGASTWVVTAAPGTGTFNVRVTGEAAKTIRWVVRFEFTEVI